MVDYAEHGQDVRIADGLTVDSDYTQTSDIIILEASHCLKGTIKPRKVLGFVYKFNSNI